MNNLALFVFLFTSIVVAGSANLRCCTSYYDNCCSTCHSDCITVRCRKTCQRHCCKITCFDDNCPDKTECPTIPVITSTETPSTTSATMTPIITPTAARYKAPRQRSSRNRKRQMSSTTMKPTVSPKIRNVTVPVAVPIKITIPIPDASVEDDNCVIIPCAGDCCQPYRSCCNGCSGNYRFVPVNPCSRRCYKRDTWQRKKCIFGDYCVSRQVNCTYCKEDFYQDYNSFNQCHGCFEP